MPKSNTQTINFDGADRPVKELSFDTIREEWNEYKVGDGTRVKVKPVVGKMFVILDEEGNMAHTADGDPWIIVRHKVEVVVSKLGE